MAIICDLSPDELNSSQVRIIHAVRKAIRENVPFNLKEYMQNEYTAVYDLVPDVTNKHATATEYARVIPQLTKQVVNASDELYDGLADVNFDFNELAQLVRTTRGEQGLENTAEYLQMTQDDFTDLVNDNANVSSSTPEPEVPNVNESNSQVGTPLARRVFNFMGQTWDSLITVPFHQARSLLPKNKQGKAKGTDITVGATPLTTFARPEGGVWNDVSNVWERTDTEDIGDFYHTVQRNIIQKMNDAGIYDSREMTIDVGGYPYPVYLTAMSVTDPRLKDLLDPRMDLTAGAGEKGVVMVLTDEFSSPFKFDEKGEANMDGRVAHYALRNTDDVFVGNQVHLKAADNERIKNLANTGYKNLPQARREAAAREEYIAQLRLIHKMREHVNAEVVQDEPVGDEPIQIKERNTAQTFINGGTVGFAVKDEALATPIRNLNWEEAGESFKPTYARDTDEAIGEVAGTTYFTTGGFYGQKIEVERPAVAQVFKEGAAFQDKLISLIVDDIQDLQGNKLSAEKRNDLIKYFIYTNPNGIQLYPTEGTAYGVSVVIAGKKQQLDVTTPGGKKQAKEVLSTYFGTYGPIREVGSNEGRIEIDEKPLGEYTSADLNKVISKTTDGETRYYVIERPKLHIRGKEDNISYIGTVFTDYNLTTDATGNVIMEPFEHAYNDFLYENFRIQYQLDKQKRIRKYDSYFTYQPTDETMNELFGDETTKALEEEMEVSNEEAAAQDPNDDLGDHLDIEDLPDRLDKLKTQKGVDVKATKKQIEAAREWFESHPVFGINGSSPIPFEALFTMINTAESNSVASWTLSGITLFKGSDFSDLYHEAWHGFTQTFLSKEEKVKLYEEVGKKSGSFVDHNGQNVSFKKASYLQIEEYLAEEFRKYMLKGGKGVKKSAPVQNSIFRKILNALKALFTHSTVEEITTDAQANNVIGELYEKLRVGDLNEYTFSQENVMFGELNQGIQASDKNQTIQNLSYQNSKLVLDTIDSHISDWIDWRNSRLTLEQMNELKADQRKLTTKLPQGERETLQAKVDNALKGAKSTFKFTSQVFQNEMYLLDAYKYVKNQIAAEHEAVKKQLQATTDQAEQDALKKKKALLLWTYNNFGTTTLEGVDPMKDNGSAKILAKNKAKKGDPALDVIGYHMLKSERFISDDVKFTLDYEGMSETDTFLKGKKFDRPGNDVAMKDIAKDELVYLIKSLHKVENGEPILNDLGGKELVSFQEVWNRLARTLQNTIDPQVMYNKLSHEAKSYPPIQQLLDKLGPIQTGEWKEATAWTNFIQVFAMARVPLVQMTLTKSTDKAKKSTYNAHSGEAFNNDTKVGRRWEASFHLNPDPRYTKRDKNNAPYLNLKAILDEFQNKKNAPKNKRLKGRELEFLHAIGWQVTDNPDAIDALIKLGDVKEVYNKLVYLRYRQKVVRSFDDITKSYDAVNLRLRDGTIRPIDERGDINSRFKNIQRFHARYGNEESNFMVTNAEGNTQFEHTLNNSMTIMVNTINEALDYRDLVSKPSMKHLNVNPAWGPVNPFAQASNWLNSIFVLDVPMGTPEYGSRRKESDKPDAPFVQVRYTNLAGALLNEEDGDLSAGVASAKADEVTKMIMDFHLVTQIGQAELMRHADKSSSYSAYLKHIYNRQRGGTSTKYIENLEFLSSPTHYNEATMALVLPHINAEFKRIKTMRSIDKDVAENIDFTYWAKGQKFTAFDDVLTQGTKSKLIKLTDTVGDLQEYLKQDGSEQRVLQQEIFADISTYFGKQVEEVNEKFSENEFIADNIYRTFMKDAKDSGRENVNKTLAKEALVKSFVYNSWINNLETIAFFYGDLALFNHQKEEFHKRNAGMGSTGNIYRTDQAMQDLINDSVKRPYSAKKNGDYKPFDGTFETAVIKDNEIGSAYYDQYLKIFTKHFQDTENLSPTAAKAKAVSTLEAYDKGRMNEGDAQGWVSFDSYKIMKIAEGSWSQEQDDMYNRIVQGETIDPATITSFFPTVKAQYFGPLQNTISGNGATDIYGLPVTAMHKFSLFPLIPTAIKGTNLEKLHDKMISEGIDYALFESGSKVGTITKKGTPDEFYEKGRKEISKEPFTKNTIFLNYLKNQLEIAPKFKEKVIFSTQMRKLIEDGLIENGVPTDFMPREKNPNVKMEAWAEIKTDEARRNSSKNYGLIMDYENNIRLLTDIKKKELLQEINWTSKMVKGEEVVDGKIEDLMDFVYKTLSAQDLAEHELDSLATRNGKLKHDLSLSLSTEKIEKLLNSLVVKRLVKQTVKGEGLVQISGALFESFASTDRDHTNATDEELAQWGTNDLPTYHRKKDGTTAAMKVKIALQGDFLKLLNAKHIDGQRINTLERLNESIRDDKWLDEGRNRDMVTMVGVRIPVQGMNSMEFMEVYEFLPASAGNIIIPPAEIVAKSGSDFDIDKLTVMMPNLSRGKRDDFTRMFNLTEKEAKAAYRKYVEAKKSPLMQQAGITRDPITKERVIRDFSAYNSLIDLLGYEVGNMDEDIEDILLAEGDIVEEDEFIANLIGAKSVENDIIGNVKSILELKENFVNLTQPNSTDIVKEIADELREDVQTYDPLATSNGEGTRTFEKGGKKQEMISPTKALEINYNMYKHSTNNIGKQTLGLGAVDNTYNTIFNRIGFFMNPTSGMTTEKFNDLTLRLEAKAKAKTATQGITNAEAKKRKIAQALTKEEQAAYWKPAVTRTERDAMGKYYRQTLFLPHNTVKVGDEKGISLSHDRDATGEYRIADIINQMLNGWVDIAKDTWIFNIQGNKEVSPTLLFLIQAGVPVKKAIYFASMPMVRDYVAAQRLAKSTYAEPLGESPQDNNPNFFRGKARENILTDPKYGFGITIDDMGGASQSTIRQAATEAISDDLLDDKGNFKFDMRKKIAQFAKEQENYNYTDEDRAAFLHYLEAENMAMPIRDVKLKMNFDTSKSGTLFEAQDRILMKEELKEDARIPMEMVDKILTDSPIGSFYIQPFQLAIWKDLFPLRSHPLITDFLLQKFRTKGKNVTGETVQDNVKSTFGDSMVFANAFRSDLINFIFQTGLRKFNKNDKYYRDYEVSTKLYELKAELDKLKPGSTKANMKRIALEKEIGKMLGIPVSDVTVLKHGVSRAIEELEDGTLIYGNELYVDKNQLEKDFALKLFLQKEPTGGYKSYAQRGLSPVNNRAFETEDEYFNFVYEREALRKSQPFAEIKGTKVFDKYRNRSLLLTANKQKEFENQAEYDKRIDKIAYEDYLRDTALTNTFNHWGLFQSGNSYADQFLTLVEAYPELKEFGLIQQMSVGTNAGYANLKLNDNFLDGDMVNVLHEQLLELMNPSVIKSENPVDNKIITDFFKKLGTVAFLQSGMNTTSAFSMTRIIPQELFIRMIEGAVKEHVEHFDAVMEQNKADDSNLTPEILERFYKKFVSANKFTNRNARIRGKKLLSVDTVTKNVYTLNDSINKFKKDVADKGKTTKQRQKEALEATEAIDISPLSAPLVVADTEGVFGYNMKDIKSTNVEGLSAEHPDKLFIYNAATVGTSAAVKNDWVFFGKRIPNSLGLPSLKTYGESALSQLRDVDGKMTDENRQAIDGIIDAIKADGRTPVFNEDGYGQQMVGKVGLETDVAKDTFLYLSKRLLEEFNYINPKYLHTPQGKTEVISVQPVTDQDVLDMMEYCINA
jgi:hypothetical protein